MSERGKITIRNPAEAIAMAKCWLNTWVTRAKAAKIDLGVGLNSLALHPAPCVYCKEPRDLLIQTLEDFKEWSGISNDSFTKDPFRLEIEQWLTLPAEEQERLVRKAQAGKPEEVPSVEPWWSA